MLIIGASHPDILALPWELLHIPGGNYLFHSNPRISIRRQFNVGGDLNLTEYQPKETVRLLFIISRPENAGFINPRSDAQAVLAAIEAEVSGQVEVEFLRPATLDALRDRLDDRRKPVIDIIHFDGHGVYDPDGRWFEEARSSNGIDPTRSTANEASDMGYLLFEDNRGQRALISAEKLATVLSGQAVRLILLSACQSAKAAPLDKANNEDDPTEGVVGSVAVQLTHAGIPTVLAMTHSVLVTATEALFGQFYQNLGRGQGIGEALDNARHHLYKNTARGNRFRGQQGEITLNLQDWFLPVLYQAGTDTAALLTHTQAGLSTLGLNTRHIKRVCAPDGDRGNLPKIQEAGFWGRSQELWHIERAFVRGTRRLSITGFGGQGKTDLAVEAGRWLYLTGMFDQVCFVDYAAYQGQDPVSYAVSTLARVLDVSLINAEAATAYLGQTPTLAILDNLESLEPALQRQLLDVAKDWSEAGQGRVLLTTRQPDFHHPDYPRKTRASAHIVIPLQGLGSRATPADALDYCNALWTLPPASSTPIPDRANLVKLFGMVDFHPLSISLLVWQLKKYQITEVGQRLAEVLQTNPMRTGETPSPLVGSLMLSLDKLDKHTRQWLPRLGVFQGGAFKNSLLAITEISEADWQPIQAQLENTGLLKTEYIPSIGEAYLKFHPTLAPVLRAQAPTSTQADMQNRHYKHYYQISNHLIQEDKNNPLAMRAIALRELPNLLEAVNQAIEAKDPEAFYFADNFSRFLYIFGLTEDQKAIAQKLNPTNNPSDWLARCLTQGDYLIGAGQYDEALTSLLEALKVLEGDASYEKCLILLRIGRCLRFTGNISKSLEIYFEALTTLKKLNQGEITKREIAAVSTDIADVLRDKKDYSESEKFYRQALSLYKELKDIRGTAVTLAQYASLSYFKEEYHSALKQYKEALNNFQTLREPEGEAVSLHHIGVVYQSMGQWDEAERCYRNSAEIKEKIGLIRGGNGVITTWFEIARIHENSGNINSAINWYEKIASKAKTSDSLMTKAASLHSAAGCLLKLPLPPSNDILSKAQKYAEEALSIKINTDPAVTEIWNTHGLLSRISEAQEGKNGENARYYRQQARQTKVDLTGTQAEYVRYQELIDSVVNAATGNLDAQRKIQSQPPPQFLEDLFTSISRILDGDRDEASLIDLLNWRDSIIILLILKGIKNI